MNKEERKKRFESMTSKERKPLILKKMKALGIELRSWIANRNLIVERFMN